MEPELVTIDININFDKSLLSFPHRLFHIWPFGQTIISETTTRINNKQTIIIIIELS